jgi:hypothetical protein
VDLGHVFFDRGYLRSHQKGTGQRKHQPVPQQGKRPRSSPATSTTTPCRQTVRR